MFKLRKLYVPIKKFNFSKKKLVIKKSYSSPRSLNHSVRTFSTFNLRPKINFFARKKNKQFIFFFKSLKSKFFFKHFFKNLKKKTSTYFFKPKDRFIKLNFFNNRSTIFFCFKPRISYTFFLKNTSFLSKPKISNHFISSFFFKPLLKKINIRKPLLSFKNFNFILKKNYFFNQKFILSSYRRITKS